MKLQPMTKPQRDNRIIALADLIHTHRIHLRKLDDDIVSLAIQLEERKRLHGERVERLDALRAERKQLVEEAAK